MILYVEILILCVFHYVGDFVLQTDEMAINKSSSNKWLTKHVNSYIAPFALFYLAYAFMYNLTLYEYVLPLFAVVINYLLHWIVDYNTSRIASSYYQAGQRGKFFKMIGFDQLLHHLCFITIHFVMFGVING